MIQIQPKADVEQDAEAISVLSQTPTTKNVPLPLIHVLKFRHSPLPPRPDEDWNADSIQ